MKAKLAVGFEARPGSSYLGTEWTEAERLELKQAIIDQIGEWVSMAWQVRWDELDLTVGQGGHLPESQVRSFILAQLASFNADTSNRVQLSLAGGDEATSAGVRYVFINGVWVCIHNYQLNWQSRGGSSASQPWTFNRFVGTSREFSTQLCIELSWPTPVA